MLILGWCLGKVVTNSRLITGFTLFGVRFRLPMGTFRFLFGAMEPYARSERVKAAVLVKTGLPDGLVIYEGDLSDIALLRRNRFDYVVIANPSRRFLSYKSVSATQQGGDGPVKPHFTDPVPIDLDYKSGQEMQYTQFDLTASSKQIFIDGEDIINVVLEIYLKLDIEEALQDAAERLGL